MLDSNLKADSNLCIKQWHLSGRVLGSPRDSYKAELLYYHTGQAVLILDTVWASEY